MAFLRDGWLIYKLIKIPREVKCPSYAPGAKKVWAAFVVLCYEKEKDPREGVLFAFMLVAVA